MAWQARNAQRGFSVGALALSITFTVLLITAPDQLDAARQWIRELPLVLEAVVWLLVGGVALSFWKGRAA